MNSIEPLNMRKCSGCGACVQICPVSSIHIDYDCEGFRRPYVKSNCIQCGKCVQVCPWQSEKESESQQALPECYGAWNTDADIRHQSSSGGIFTAIAKEIIAQSGVIFGAKYNDKFEIVHDFCETDDALSGFRGSKYAESNLKNVFSEVKNFIKMKRKVLFTGTPCQIAGLKQFLNMETPYLFTMDFLCHGVAPQKLWLNYVQYMKKKYCANPLSINMRDKSKGWGKYIMKICFSNHKIYISKSFMDIYHILFLKAKCLRLSCYHCIFTTPYRASDITVADFWGAEKLYPEIQTDPGMSLMLLNTEKGNFMFHSLMKNKIIESFPADIDAIREFNRRLSSQKIPENDREIFFQDLASQPFHKLIKKWARPIPGSYIPFHKKIYYKIIYELKKLKGKYS